MSTAEVPSSNLWIPYSFPRRFISYSGTGTNISQTVTNNVFINSMYVILGCDLVASGSEPVQCFVNLQIPQGVQVYYDSQSTGEGLGVRFPWRGQIPLFYNDTLEVDVSSNASINWYITVWGLLWSTAVPE